MCIYYKNKKDLTYAGAEHIISAGIGGVRKLPEDYVSQEFNNDFSQVEQDFIRNSWVSMTRPIVGPGKRGSLSEKKASKSKVVLMDERTAKGEFSLGYMKQGRPYEIPMIRYDEKEKIVNFSYDRSEGQDAKKMLADFVEKLTNPSRFKLKVIENATIPETVIVFGHAESVEENYNYFLAKHPNQKVTVTPETMKTFAAALTDIPGRHAEHKQYVPKMHMQMTVKEDDFRVVAKYAFNTLAARMKKEFVTHDCFDEIRNWIAYGGENKYAWLNSDLGAVIAGSPIKLPAYYHLIQLLNVEGTLLANVILYENFGTTIKLAENTPLPFQADALICDWKNRKEYWLIEYVAQHGATTQNNDENIGQSIE